MINLSEIISFMEKTFPLSYAEDFDNVGLLCGRCDKEVSKVLICLDCTNAVVKEAIESGCELIISHHPVIFEPIKSVSDDSPLGKIIISAIENNISIYSAHTNLDSAKGGLTDYIANLLGLEIIGNLENNLGRIHKAPEGYSSKDLIEKLKEALGIERIYTTLKENKSIEKIALCNGGGSDLIDSAMESGADVYISGDLKHHNILSVNESKKLDYIEIRHYDCEAPMKRLVCDLLKKEFGEKIEVRIASSCKAPLIDADNIM